MHKLHIYKKNKSKTPKQSDGEDNVEVPASRVCYLDKGKGYTGNQSDKYEKGALYLWTWDNPGYTGFTSSSWFRSNLKLWDYFRDKYSIDKFDEWYDKQTTNSNEKNSGIKNILR